MRGQQSQPHLLMSKFVLAELVPASHPKFHPKSGIDQAPGHAKDCGSFDIDGNVHTHLEGKCSPFAKNPNENHNLQSQGLGHRIQQPFLELHCKRNSLRNLETTSC